MKVTEKQEPTHILTVEIPLNLTEPYHTQLDACKEALQITIAVSRAAFFNQICGEPIVGIKKPVDKKAQN